MSNFSSSAIKTCKPNTGDAEKMYSQRIFSPASMVCPTWNGIDSSGRPACKNSFKTTSPGCVSASERVSVENFVQRPKFMNAFIDNKYSLNNKNYDEQSKRNEYLTGNYGIQFNSNIKSNCY